MTNASNGQDVGHRDPGRRLRVDDLAAIVLRNSPGPAAPRMTAGLDPGHSGRRFVVVAGMCVLLIWGTLFLVFREWRASYRERALFGATHVVTAIEPMRGIIPPHVDPVAWKDAVDETRAMLLTVTGSNLLDIKQMGELRIEISERVRKACSQPATATRELAQIWDQVADRGEFLLKDGRSRSGERHPRPSILPPRPQQPFSGSAGTPPGGETGRR